MTGRKLGNYEVVDKLGEGGMGEVWRARDSRLNRSVALKVLPADVAGDPARRQRFEQEARALGTLNHPNIVAVYDIGQSDGQAYIVSELVDGESLRKVIDRGPMSVRKLVDAGVQMAEAIAAAHALGIVHRDLKPENVMMTRDSRVKVLDFGLAKQSAAAPGEEAATVLLSQPGMVLGTVGYMAPEQVRGEAVDARSDIFSLGCVLYEMATGNRAFAGQSAADVMSAILKEEPPEMTAGGAPLPTALDAIVRRCLEKDPSRRFQSAADLAFALRSVVTSSTTQMAAAPAAKAAAKRNWRVPAGLAIASVVMLAAGYLLHSRLHPVTIPQYQRLTFREGHVNAARFTPDGEHVVYSAGWDGGPAKLYLGTPGNPESRDMEAPPNSHLLGVSSKGDLALLVGPFHPDETGTLARGSVAGGQVRELLEHVLMADWSPDGSEMAVARQASGVTSIEYPLGKVVYKSEWGPFGMRISPDGQQLAFANYAEGSRVAIYLVDRSGKTKRLAIVSGQSPNPPNTMLCWSPDGREIWFRSFDSDTWNTIYAVNLQGERRVAARFPGQIALHDIAADGRVLISSENVRLGIRGLAPGETVERDLSCLESSQLRGISRDGSVILADISGQAAGPKGSIYLRRTDGSAPVRLGDGVAFTLSPDGKWVSGYTSRESAHRKFVIMPTGPGENIEVRVPELKSAAAFGWLTDGKYMLEGMAKGKDGWQFYSWDAQSGAVQPISPENMPDEIPLISPDGRSYMAVGPDHERHLYAVAGGEPKPVTGLTPHDQPLGWRADGRAIYVSTHHDENRMVPVSVIDLESGKRTPWKEIRPSIPVDWVGNLLVTPDGSAYAYNYRYERSDLYLAEGLRAR